MAVVIVVICFCLPLWTLWKILNLGSELLFLLPASCPRPSPGCFRVLCWCYADTSDLVEHAIVCFIHLTMYSVYTNMLERLSKSNEFLLEFDTVCSASCLVESVRSEAPCCTEYPNAALQSPCSLCLCIRGKASKSKC